MKDLILRNALFLLLGIFCCIHLHAQTIINMEQSGGVYYIPCEVNGLRLKFVFDTGASNVSISMSEALFMLKNDYLRESDIKGTNRYRTASGSIEEGTSIILRQIKIGDKYLYNVEASIVNSLDAPLLLGQSALSKLGSISVDYSRNELIIGGSSTSRKAAANKQTSEIDWIPPEVEKARRLNQDSDAIESVQIGNQVWMAENLNVDRFRNGDLIPQANTAAEWERAGQNKQPAWCYYDNDPANGAIYGKLYNWYAVNDPRGLAPEGWYIPSDAEWTKLTDFLGGSDVDVRVLKNAFGWVKNKYYDGNGTNETGFSGLPGGLTYPDGTFSAISYAGGWWSSTEYDIVSAWNRTLYYSRDQDYSNGWDRFNYQKTFGWSVRCLRN